jgi:hypothetical protein
VRLTLPVLVAWLVSPTYVALTARVPVAVGVILTEHVAVVPVPANVQVPLGVKFTVPVGVLDVPVAVSVTVAVQLVAWLTNTGEGVHATVVVVVRLLTVTLALPVLVPWLASPPYEAETVRVPETVGVVLTEHVADAPVPARVQVPPGVKVTVPVGVIAVPVDVSATVAVHDVACPMNTVDGVHATVVVVARTVTVTLADPLLPAWFESPP